ncbi:MAG: glucose-1-phosphate adenylyltransferase [Halanaerobiales bacterium]
MQKKEIICMLLAGGQGTRLKDLTYKKAKPAVYFGGKYRIIDFPLSNCSNSGIDTVGVLTQYEPFALNSYLSTGSPWDINSSQGGVFVLPPYVSKGGRAWYSGTANAVYNNLGFIDQFNPEYVLILSGDHIYKMDYIEMLDFHKEKQADVSISVLEVPWEETHRFGIMNTDEKYRIIEFQEKPDNAKNNLASMGIYIFKWGKLRKYLKRAEKDQKTLDDFGHDIIPMMLEDGNDVFAYPFEGYWKDVGTVESLWEANMDLLTESPGLNLDDPDWHWYAKNPNLPAHFVSRDANVKNSLINEGCVVYGDVESSLLSFDVSVGKGSLIKDSVLMPNVQIGENVNICKAIIGEGAIIEDNVVIGEDKISDVTLIGDHERVKE